MKKLIFVLLLFPSFASASMGLELYEYEKKKYLEWFLSADHSDYYWTYSVVRGRSMEQYGIKDGDRIKLFYLKDCSEGDFCAFTCKDKKCGKGKLMLKKTVKEDNGCYWFEGNPLPVKIGKKYLPSWDSREYGWLCGNDLEINGVVRN